MKLADGQSHPTDLCSPQGLATLTRTMGFGIGIGVDSFYLLSSTSTDWFQRYHWQFFSGPVFVLVFALVFLLVFLLAAVRIRSFLRCELPWRHRL